jgi:hypothetical protein
LADQLTISHNVKNSSLVKQISSALAHVCHGARPRLLSVNEILSAYKAFEKSIDFVIEHRSGEHGLKQAGVLAGFAFAHAALGAPVEKWFEELNSGKGLINAEDYLKIRKACKDARPLEHLRYFLISDESALFSKNMNRAIAQVTLQVVYGEAHKVRTQALEQSEVGTKWFCAKLKEPVSKIAGLFVQAYAERKQRPE